MRPGNITASHLPFRLPVQLRISSETCMSLDLDRESSNNTQSGTGLYDRVKGPKADHFLSNPRPNPF